MAVTEHTLKSIIDPVPKDLLEYFDSIAERPDNDPAHLLNATDCVKQSNVFRGFHPIVQALNGLILDDPNTSNHHVYLAKPPVDGYVLFLNHDGDSRIVFRSLSEFLDAVKRAEKTNHYLQTLHEFGSVTVANQDALNNFTIGLLDDDNNSYAEEVLLAVIPSMELTNVPLLERLVIMEDFYIVEAVANEIVRRPSKALEQIALLCAKHKHPQAANAGQKAVAAVHNWT